MCSSYCADNSFKNLFSIHSSSHTETTTSQSRSMSIHKCLSRLPGVREHGTRIKLHTTLECAWPVCVYAAVQRGSVASTALSRRPEMRRRKSTVMRWRRVNRRQDCGGVNCARARTTGIRLTYGHHGRWTRRRGNATACLRRSQLHSRQIPLVLVAQRPPACRFRRLLQAMDANPTHRSLLRNSYSNNEHVTYFQHHSVHVPFRFIYIHQ